MLLHPAIPSRALSPAPRTPQMYLSSGSRCWAPPPRAFARRRTRRRAGSLVRSARARAAAAGSELGGVWSGRARTRGCVWACPCYSSTQKSAWRLQRRRVWSLPTLGTQPLPERRAARNQLGERKGGRATAFPTTYQTTTRLLYYRYTLL